MDRELCLSCAPFVVDLWRLQCRDIADHCVYGELSVAEGCAGQSGEEFEDGGVGFR